MKLNVFKQLTEGVSKGRIERAAILKGLNGEGVCTGTEIESGCFWMNFLLTTVVKEEKVEEHLMLKEFISNNMTNQEVLDSAIRDKEEYLAINLFSPSMLQIIVLIRTLEEAHHISELRLSIKGYNPVIMRIFAEFLGHNNSIEELMLCGLDSEGVDIISSALPFNTNLKILVVSFIQLNVETARKLGTVVSKSCIEQLWMNCCGLKDEGLSAFLDNLTLKNLGRISVLGNQITDQGVNKLLEFIKLSTNKQIRFSLNQNDEISDDGARKLLKFIKNNPSVKITLDTDNLSTDIAKEFDSLPYGFWSSSSDEEEIILDGIVDELFAET